MYKNLKVLFVGLGSIGKRHIKNLKFVADKAGIELTIDALRSSKSNIDDEIKLLINKEYYNYEKLPYYDIIFITNPSYLHYETVLKLNSNTSNFFIEKPLDVQPLNDMQLNIFNNDKIYYVACPLRHTKIFKKIEELVKNNKVYCARAICSSYLPQWRKNTDYRLLYSAKKESGGVKIDLIHEFDYLFKLFGFPQNYSLYEKKISKLEIESNDYLSFIGDYGDKFIELHLDYFGRQAVRNIELYTEDDVIICDFNNNTMKKNNIVEFYDEEINDRYINEITYFLSLIEFKNNNLNDIINANNVLKLITQGDR